MSRRAAIALLVLVLLSGAPLAAEAPEEQQLGRVSFPNSGAPEAQEAFLAGLAALHSFFYDEAADLFRRAQEIDPGFALAYWGEAMTHNHPLWQEVDPAAARAALGRLGATPAERAAKAGLAIEKAFLAAVELLYGEGSKEERASKEERDQAYADALERLYAEHPQDHEAAAFYALALQGLQRPGAVDPRRQMRSAAVLEEVFAANPLHPGAAHYLIHAYDDPVHAPLGLRPARVYADIAPSAPHALHMPSHIFVQLGMWDEAAASNVDAYAASVGWVERRGHPLDKRDFHSLSWLQYAYLQLGRVDDAAQALAEARQVAAQVGTPHMQGVVAGMEARQVIETASGPLEARMAGTDAAGAEHCATTAGIAEPGAALLFARGYRALAGPALEAADGRAEADPEGALADGRAAIEALAARADEAGEDQRGRRLRVRQRELEGLLALAESDEEAGLVRLAEAVELEEALGTPYGPPSPEKPALELYGEALLARGRPADAGEQFARSLLRTPRRAASLLGAARSAAARGDEPAAREHYGRLLAVWHAADPDLPALAEARRAAGPGAVEPAP